jgi:hypothetical protein
VESVLNELSLFALAFGSGFLVRLTLSAAGQIWARTYSNTVTYLLLPIVGLVIVQVISNSITLSLGMIGALSIIRFRHPVKSPLELVIYFLLLTVGVSLTTRPELGIALTLVSCLVITGVSLIQRQRMKNGLVAFPVSPSDGEGSYLLELESSRPVHVDEIWPYLLLVSEMPGDGRYSYKFGFPSMQLAEEWRIQLLGLEGMRVVRGIYA